ncbi:trehalose-6-phosphate hydrolase [Raoultella terrigena]|uniref:Trehalose-6-phosphate hydrolase n=1 Tax=Raoultella terrigena TaxID=577 RepID=A0A485AY23_RAOTE|nr:trehalose-6-phosphate hydrolase [Raoultella terrigena]VUD32821.1 trehalose-6-phosphate hydrolase [Raoultella sp. NCTC 9187]
MVVANLSREFQNWQPDEMKGDWRVLMSNYAEAANRPAAMTLRPFEAVWWLQE